MKRFFALLLLTFTIGQVSAQTTSDDGIYREFGEKAGISALMEDFVKRLVADPRTQSSFKNANLPRLQLQLTEQLCMLSGGPCKYAGLDMKTAHAKMPVGKTDFNALVEVLQDAMDAKGIPFRAQNRMLALLAPMHRDIINR